MGSRNNLNILNNTEYHILSYLSTLFSNLLGGNVSLMGKQHDRPTHLIARVLFDKHGLSSLY
jgi:purine-cytosine permease-like protein